MLICNWLRALESRAAFHSAFRKLPSTGASFQAYFFSFLSIQRRSAPTPLAVSTFFHRKIRDGLSNRDYNRVGGL
jgi:hypothetical protein